MPHSGSAVELALLVGVWVSQPQGCESEKAHSGCEESCLEGHNCRRAIPTPQQL